MKISLNKSVVVLSAVALISAILAGPAGAGNTWLDANGIITSGTGTPRLTLNNSAVSNATYWIDPPFLSAKVPPNVFILLDNSGSMNCPAYPGSYDPSQFDSGDYFGYYDPHSMYQYDSTNKDWNVTTADPASATTAQPIASGNFLNWATMRKIDVAKKLLNGGKADNRAPVSPATVKLLGEDPKGQYCDTNPVPVIGEFDNSGAIPASHLPSGYANVIYPFLDNYQYKLDAGGGTCPGTTCISQLLINPGSGSGSPNPYVYPLSNNSIPAGWTVTGAGGAAWDAVNDLKGAADNDTTKITTTTLNQSALFNYDVPAASVGGVISQVNVVVVVKESANNTQKVAAVLLIDGVEYPATGVNDTTSYNSYTFTWTSNPAIGLPWSWTDIQSGGVAASLQAFGARMTANSVPATVLSVTSVYLWFQVSTPSGGPYDIRVDTGKSTPDTGIIGSLSSSARFGLGYYNSDAEGGRVWYKDTSNNTVYSYVDFNNSANLIASVDLIKANTSTPLAESLYTFVKYFRQESAPYHNSGGAGYDYITGSSVVNDPYYYMYSKVPGSGLTDQYVPCTKSFILLMTDGEPTEDLNIPAWLQDYNGDGVDATYVCPAGDSNCSHYVDDVAYWARSVDARADLAGDQRIYTYSVFMFGKGSKLLQQTSLWGGFDDLDGTNRPSCLDSAGNIRAGVTQDQLKECYRDSNNNGVLDPYDSVTNPNGDFPLTYYEGNDGYALQQGIVDAISAILKRAASGTSVSVLGSSWKGDGAVYQAFFYPEKVESLRTIVWTGYFQSLFVDRYGLIHEDTDGDGKLVPNNDMVVVYSYDAVNNTTILNYYWDKVNNSTGDLVPDGILDTSVPVRVDVVSAAKPIWDAGKLLAARDPADRTIYTSINADTTTPGMISFDSSNAAALRPYIRAKTSTDATNLINYIRGATVTGWRDRGLTVDGTLETWKLGDMVYSNPVVVSSPTERYDTIYNDTSYKTFYNQYANRRAMVYIGGNDGMLHAFNGGFSISNTKTSPMSSDTQVAFCTTNAVSTTDPMVCGSQDLTKPLGKELWSFIPYDLLPHLAWLADPGYQHVYYVDQMTRITDAQIFTVDATHPNGWGTILIVGFRLGGGELDVTDTFSGAASTKAFKSAFYCLDITDPESAPVLLWRFTDDELGFTTSVPTVLREMNGNTPKWYAIFGSGPSNYKGGRVVDTTITNTKFTKNPGTTVGAGMQFTNPHLFIVDLATGKPDPAWSLHATSNRKGVIKTSMTNGVIGDLTTTDWPLDFKFDSIYFGSGYCSAGCNAEGVPAVLANWAGKLHRIRTENNWDTGTWVLSDVFDASNPVIAKASVGIDERGNVWIYVGTGKFLYVDDRFDTSQQYFFGVKDQCYYTAGCTTSTTIGANIFSAASYSITSTGAVSPALAANALGAGKPPAAVSNFNDLADFMRDLADGWKLALGSGERVTVNGFVTGGISGFGTYTPSGDLCEFTGLSRQYFPYYLTGTPFYSPQGTYLPTVSVSTGGGLPSAPAVHVDSSGAVKLFIQKSTGEIQVINLSVAQGVTGGYGAGAESVE